ncbi:hypothetical protein AB0N07_34510 [Streptomyces sp. NPDC051172]|uniref:hypothetical protein n=1 Tax=Streptomyces sp. NPDC051172 TaxID=3155796 RepID=UPI0034484EAC
MSRSGDPDPATKTYVAPESPTARPTSRQLYKMPQHSDRNTATKPVTLGRGVARLATAATTVASTDPAPVVVRLLITLSVGCSLSERFELRAVAAWPDGPPGGGAPADA